MVIEWLKFKVPAEVREKFIQKDGEIWTPALAKSPGFLGKEVWLNPNASDELVLVIHWQTREAWSAVPSDLLEETDRQFAREMGAVYPIVEAGEYQVRKFPHS